MLWQIRTNNAINGFPVSYSVNGKQYVAVSVGNGSSHAEVACNADAGNNRAGRRIGSVGLCPARQEVRPVAERGGTLRSHPAVAHLRFLLLCAVWLVCLCPVPSWAATPFVVDEWRFGTQETNSVLRYCIDARDPDWPIARRIAAAVAGALLLQPKEYLTGDDPRTANMSGDDLDDTYRMLIQRCDVFFGFKLVPDAYPDWITITRPYYRGAYVYVAADPTWKSLGDMPTTRAIGATIGTSADMRLTQYLLAAPADKRWDKYPMSSDEAALRAVMHGATRRGFGLGAGALVASENRCRHSDIAGDGTRSLADVDGRYRCYSAAEADVPAEQSRSGDCLADRRRHHRGILKDANFPGAPVPR